LLSSPNRVIIASTIYKFGLHEQAGSGGAMSFLALALFWLYEHKVGINGDDWG
jgi:hypothetical protein